MGINLLAFIIVAACNLYLYCRLGKISSIMTSNSKMFRMVFVRIVTDFICWAPLVTLSLAALFRQDLIRTSHFKWFAVLVLPMHQCLCQSISLWLTNRSLNIGYKICVAVLKESYQDIVLVVSVLNNSVTEEILSPWVKFIDQVILVPLGFLHIHILWDKIHPALCLVVVYHLQVHHFLVAVLHCLHWALMDCVSVVRGL